MKAKIKIERYDNGISLKWQSQDADDQSEVALDYDKEKAVGKMIWDDIKNVMNAALCDEVEMTIEYKAVKENI